MLKTTPIKTSHLCKIDIDKELGTYSAPPITKPISKYNLFIKGPIPFEWLRRANSLGGTTGAIAVGLWFYAGLTKCTQFKIDGKLDLLAGVTRHTRQAALARMERAGLISIERLTGAFPLIKIHAR